MAKSKSIADELFEAFEHLAAIYEFAANPEFYAEQVRHKERSIEKIWEGKIEERIKQAEVDKLSTITETKDAQLTKTERKMNEIAEAKRQWANTKAEQLLEELDLAREKKKEIERER